MPSVYEEIYNNKSSYQEHILNELDFSTLVNIGKGALAVAGVVGGAYAAIDNVRKAYIRNKAKRKYDNSDYMRYSSFIRASRDLIFSFPVLCDYTITPSTSNIIVKAIERRAVDAIRVVFAASNLRGINGFEIAAKFQKNIDVDSDINDYLDSVVAAINTRGAAVDAINTIKGLVKREGTILSGSIEYAKIQEDYKQGFIQSLGKRYEDNFSDRAISEYAVINRYGYQQVVKEARGDNADPNDSLYWTRLKQELDHTKYDFDKEKFAYQKNRDVAKDLNDKQNRDADIKYRDERDKIKDKMDQDRFDLSKNQFDYQQKRDTKQDEYRAARDNLIDQRDARDYALSKSKANTEFLTRQLLDNDVKKSNELQPSLLIVRYRDLSPEAGEQTTDSFQEFVIGVKARMIAVPTNEIVDNIVKASKRNIDLKNLIKATTKETKFAKDFALAIDSLKDDAKKAATGNTNAIWRMIQNRAAFAKKPGGGASVAAITSLVITAQDAAYLDNQYGIDVSLPSVAREILKNFNLMILVIVDEQTEVAKFFLDGEKFFTDYAFSSLEKENHGQDLNKQLVNLVGKGAFR